MARQFTRRVRSRTRWSAATSASTFLALAAGTTAQTFFTAGTVEETILRVRGNLTCWMNGTQSPGVSALIGVGMIVMPEGTSTTVTSSPISDGNAPWFWYTSFIIGYEEMVTDVVDVPGLSSYREVIDSKAMRILRPDREVQLVAENVAIGGTMNVDLAMHQRILLQHSG